MRKILFLCLALVATTLSAAEKPNILFIAIDDQNDWIGCLGGHPLAKTPNIDKIAERGTVFLNAHCQAPLCNPSRTSLMTGKRPSTTGVYGLAPWFRQVPKWKDLVSLPQHLEANGYSTYSTGKIYHGGYGRRKNDDEFQTLGPPAGVGARPKEKLVKTPAPHPLVDWGVFPHKDEDKQDYVVASWAVEQIEKGPEDPFFLSVGFFLPHVPCYTTQKWYDLYPDDDSVLPLIKRNDRDDTPRSSWWIHWKLPEPRLKFLEEANEWHNLCRSYLACTSFVDHQIGRIMTALDEKGLRDDTIIVLWSDHGWHIGEKEITGKNTLWDDGTRVPLMFAGPGISAGEKVTSPAELLDIYPTLIELCDLPNVDGLEGHSLVPQLKDPKAPRKWPAITTHNRGNHGIRTENYRYIHYVDGAEEFYDLRKDPREWNNIIDDPDYQSIIAEHRQWLPKVDVEMVPGSRARVLSYKNGKVIWEGEEIKPDDPIPEIEE
ncbi:MAG: sulfatase [Planctomycetaceae bacterium]|nr:sulfatase [Planctomycetaceae bacterium]